MQKYGSFLVTMWLYSIYFKSTNSDVQFGQFFPLRMNSQVQYSTIGGLYQIQ